MRNRFEPQIQMGTKDITEIEFNLSSRHEITPILMGLQYLYVNCRDRVLKIFELIQKDISRGKNQSLGCKGMSYWETLVLTSLRLGCNLDYDQLADLASYHYLIRQMLMKSDWDRRVYARSTIHENINLLSPETIEMISRIIVSIGHEIELSALNRVRGDTWVVKKNIHYPTDTNLVYDGIRKIIGISVKLADIFSIPGWRSHEYLKKKAKGIQRKIAKIASSRSVKREKNLKAGYYEMIKMANGIVEKSLDTISGINLKTNGIIPVYWKNYISELQYYIGGTEYVCELAHRRIIEGKQIPNPEKVFSLFEPDTELINRGKKPNPIEFGHRVLIIQDKAGFIIHSSVLGNGFTDEKIILEVMQKLQKRYNNKIKAASFDKGFWTPHNLEELSETIPLIVLPKKGKLREADKDREGAKEFVIVRKWHSGIESAINSLEAGNGLDVCRDKGVTGYKRYIAMAVLGRNLQTLGAILINKIKRENGDSNNLLMKLVG